MRTVVALLATALLLAVGLYGSQPDAPVALVEVSRGGLGDRSHGRGCEIRNLDVLKRSAIVYTWVNGTERCYNDRRARAGLPPGGSSRDKEMGELKYSLRSLLKFAPWLEGPIYIVTPGQIPEWLDTSNPRIRVIDQDDLLPRDKTTLPNFDTNVIEQYLHKIPGLTDVFIHMNDDYLFLKPVGPERFFTCDGGLRFLTEVNHIRHVKGTKSNAWLASVRNTVELTDRTYGGEHVYNFVKHAPFVYSREAFERMHKRFGPELDATLSHQIRHHEDLNVPLLHHIYMNEEGSAALGIPIEFNPIAESDDWLLVRITDTDHETLRAQFQRALDGKGPEVLFALNDEYSTSETAELVGKFYEALLPSPEFYELPAGQRVSIASNYHGADCTYDPEIIPFPTTSTPYISLRRRLEEESAMKIAPSPLEVYFRGREVVDSARSGDFGINVAYAVGVLLSVFVSILVFRFTNQDLLRSGSTHTVKNT